MQLYNSFKDARWIRFNLATVKVYEILGKVLIELYSIKDTMKLINQGKVKL